MKIRILVGALALAAFVAAPGAPSAAETPPQQSTMEKQGAQQQAAPAAEAGGPGKAAGTAAQPGSEQVTGRVTGVRTIDLQGEKQPHLLARVQLASGETRLLDLGPLSHLQQQQRTLKTGQQVKASGRPGRINELAVLVVDRLEGDGIVTVIPISASASQSRQQADRGASPRDRTVQGHVQSLRESRIEGRDTPHQLVRVRTGQGQTVVVDLGERKPGALALQEGDAIIAIGTIGRLNGKPVLFADRVAEVAMIDRAGDAGAESGAAAPPQRASSSP